MRNSRLLAVDDNERNLAILRKALAQHFELHCAASGEAALEMAASLRPDLVLLDVMMPGIDGYETCRQLRQNPRLSNAKIIMVSAKAMTAERLAGYEAGADDYVVKPFNQDELLAKVRVYTRLKAVEEMDRLKSDLLGLLSHETRTPLTSILSPAQLLLEDASLNDEQRQMLRMIERGGLRLLTLVEKALFLSQLKAEAVTYDPHELNLDVLVQRAAEKYRGTAAEKQVQIVVETNGEPLVRADRDHLQDVLDSIVDNAIKASATGETVTLAAWSDGEQATLSVSDNGTGIAADLLPQIFDGFVVKDVRYHREGHGLSLAVAKLVVEQHGGSISTLSATGQGTTMCIHLPALMSQRAAA